MQYSHDFHLFWILLGWGITFCTAYCATYVKDFRKVGPNNLPKTGNKRAHSCKDLFCFKKIQIMSYDNVLRFSGIFVRSQVFSNFRFPKFQFFNRFPHTDQNKKLLMWETGQDDFNPIFEGCFHENRTDIKTVGDNFYPSFMEKIRWNNSQKIKRRK